MPRPRTAPPAQEQALAWTYRPHKSAMNCTTIIPFGGVFSLEEARFICNAGKLYAAAERIRKIIKHRWRALLVDSEEKRAMHDLVTAMDLMTGTNSPVVTKTPPGARKPSQKP